MIVAHIKSANIFFGLPSIDVGLQGRTPAWLQRSEEPPSGKIVGMPTRDDVSLPVNENLVVEYCSR